MNLFVDILRIVLPVFLVIGLGFFLRRIAMIDAPFIATTNRLVYYVCLPLLLFYKIGSADFDANFNPALVFTCIGISILTYAASYLGAALFGLPDKARGVFSQGSCRGNLAYMGLALVFNAYGEEGLTRAGILMGFLVPIYNLGSIIVLTLPQRQATGLQPLQILRQILLNPLIIASAVGILWSLFNLPLPIVFERGLKIATGMTLPLALLAIGGSFSLQRLRGDLRLASVASLLKLALVPALTGAVLLAVGVQGLDLAVGLLIAGAPAATANYIMAAELKADAELAGTIVMLSTLASAVSYSILLLLLHL